VLVVKGTKYDDFYYEIFFRPQILDFVQFSGSGDLFGDS